MSVSTVSNALRETRHVNPDTVSNVARCASELGYRVDNFASVLRTGKSNIIGMVVPEVGNPFFSSLVSAIEQKCTTENFELIVANSQGSDSIELNRIEALNQLRLAGLILVPNSNTTATIQHLERQFSTFVVADRFVDTASGDCVTLDNYGAGREIANHLADLGHTHILTCASTLELHNIEQRVAGIDDELVERGGSPARTLAVGSDFECATHRIAPHVDDATPLTAIIALTNFITVAAIAAFRINRIRVPDEMSLVGFDDYAWMQAFNPAVTAYKQPVDEIADNIWGYLKKRLNARREVVPGRSELQGSLIIRESTSIPRTMQPAQTP